MTKKNECFFLPALLFLPSAAGENYKKNRLALNLMKKAVS